MSTTLPTTLAVAGAIAHFRELRDLTCAELGYLLSLRSHELTLEEIFRIERGEQSVTVDDLVALAHVLDVTPNDLLGHVPMPPSGTDGGPIGTGLPEDLAPEELADWLSGRLQLDDASRAIWWERREADAAIYLAHCEDQLEAAVDELRDLGELALQEADARPVQRLHVLIREGELAVYETGQMLDVMAMRLDQLRGPELG